MSNTAKCLVQCATFPDKFYEYLIRMEDGVAIIGAKRVVSFGNVETAHISKHTNNNIEGKTELINGVNFDCLHCKSQTLLHCDDCGSWSCATVGDTLPCCNILVKSTSGRETVTATNAQDTSNKIGVERKYLSHNPTG